MPRTRADREGERPIPNKTRPNTDKDPEQVSRIEPPSTDDPSPSTKTCPVSLPVARALEVGEGLTRGTNAPSNVIARRASESDREGPAARVMPGERGSPAKVELGSVHGTKALRYHQEFLDSRQRQKNLVDFGIDGHAEILRSLRGHEI